MSSSTVSYVMPIVARAWSRAVGCLCLAMAALSIVCAAPTAYGDVIYSNLGPDDSYFTTGYQIGMGEDIAVPFTPIGADYKLTTVEIALWRQFPGTFDLVLMSDAGGLPGTILDSMIVDVPASGGLLSISSTTNPLLTQGTQYWIASHTEPGGYYAFWNWSFTKGTFASYYEGWNTFSDLDLPAMRVNGVQEVPEPTTLAMWGMMGMAGIAAVWLRRRSVARST